MKNNNTPDELVIARLWVRNRLPYLTNAIMALRPVCRPGLGTCCTDRYMRLYFDPATITQWSREELGFAVAHEALHNSLRHFDRIKQFDNIRIGRLSLENIAKDLAINSMLVSSGLTAPEGVILPRSFGFPDGLSVEEYAGLLIQHHQQEHNQEGEHGEECEEEDGDGGRSQGDDSGEDGKIGEAQTDDRDRGAEGQEDESGPSDRSKQERTPCEEPPLKPGAPYTGRQPDRSQGEGGSSCDGVPKPWECPPPDASSDPSDNPPGLDEWNQEWIVRKDAEALENHPEWGNCPGMLRREAARLLRPKTDPVALLRAAVKFAITQTAGYGTFTYRRPSRKQIPGGAILPAHRACVPRVVVIADTSGSMGGTDMALAMGIVQSVLQGLPDPRGVQVIAGDTAVRTCERVFRPEQVTLSGGGGTNMRRLILEACEQRPAPDVIICCTDGCSPFPEAPVRPKVVIALTRKSGRSYIPKWMEVVEVNPEE